MATMNDPGQYAQDPLSYIDFHQGLPLIEEGVGELGIFFVHEIKHLARLQGSMLDVDSDAERVILQRPKSSDGAEPQRSESAKKVKRSIRDTTSDHEMSTQDRYIDDRLTGIESKIDSRMEMMQRFQERSEDRFERAAQRHDAEIALQRQRSDEAYRDLYNLVDNSRKHASNMAAVTIFGTIGGVLAALALVITLGAGWLSDQSAWLRQSVERIEAKIEAPVPAATVQEPAAEEPSSE